MEREFIATNELLINFKKYLEEEERSDATVEKYLRDVRHFKKYLGSDNRITRERVRTYKQKLITDYQITSANSMLAALNQFLLYIGAHDFRVKRIKMQKAVFREEDKEMSESEYKRLVQKAYSKGKTRLALIMETICSTGIRISELKYFTANAVKNGRVQINNKGKVRVVLIPQQLKNKLLCYISKHMITNGSIFVTSNGNPLDRSNIWRDMKKLGADAEIPVAKIYPHNLRHLFAAIYYNIFKDLIGLADILGHSSIETTRVYTARTETEYKQRLDHLSLVL